MKFYGVIWGGVLADSASPHQSPLLMNSKKDYQRVLQSHEQLFLKVEDSMRRCQKAEVEKEKALSRRNSLALELETAKE